MCFDYICTATAFGVSLVDGASIRAREHLGSIQHRPWRHAAPYELWTIYGWLWGFYCKYAIVCSIMVHSSVFFGESCTSATYTFLYFFMQACVSDMVENMSHLPGTLEIGALFFPKYDELETPLPVACSEFTSPIQVQARNEKPMRRTLLIHQ